MAHRFLVPVLFLYNMLIDSLDKRTCRIYNPNDERFHTTRREVSSFYYILYFLTSIFIIIVLWI